MLLGACAGVIIGPLFVGWRAYPWPALPFALAAIVILHPIMDKDVPSLIGIDMLRSARTYIAIMLFACAQLVATPYQKEFVARIMNAR